MSPRVLRHALRRAPRERLDLALTVLNRMETQHRLTFNRRAVRRLVVSELTLREKQAKR